MLIVSKNENEVLKSVEYLLNQERLEYEIDNKYKNTNYDKVIFITSDVTDIPKNIKKDFIIISDKKIDLKNYSSKSNEIITPLINDNNEYSASQEEYLYRDGIYSVINEIDKKK